jgi:hypothetical protein
MKKLLIPIGLILLALAGVWKFGLSSRFTQRIPDNWAWHASFVGIATWADEATGEYPLEDDVSTYERTISIIGRDDATGSLLLEDEYESRDVNTGVVTWEFIFTAPVDPATGMHTSDEYRGDIFVFPRNVEKKPYNFRQTSYTGLPLAFIDETVFEGLNTYHFAFSGEIDNSFSYSGSENFPGVALEPGQTILCKDLVLDVWVEPVTGEMVQLVDGCRSGDAVYDASGNLVYRLSRWGGESTGDDVIRRVGEIENLRMGYLWASSYLPLLLLGLGIASLGAGTLFMFRTPSSKTETNTVHAGA